MTDLEQLRAFIERVKGEHRTGKGAGDSDAWPNDALRAVLALEEMLECLDWYADEGNYVADDDGLHLASAWQYGGIADKAKQALARAAQKIGK